MTIFTNSIGFYFFTRTNTIFWTASLNFAQIFRFVIPEYRKYFNRNSPAKPIIMNSSLVQFSMLVVECNFRRFQSAYCLHHRMQFTWKVVNYRRDIAVVINEDASNLLFHLSRLLYPDYWGKILEKTNVQNDKMENGLEILIHEMRTASGSCTMYNAYYNTIFISGIFSVNLLRIMNI